MLAGEIYSAVDPQLIEELTEVKEIIHDYNLLRPSEIQKGKEILKGLMGHITIGAGSVVTKDIPSNSIAVGNPCKVIKTL